LEQWQIVDWPFQSWLDQGTALNSKIPVSMALAATLLPVALAIFSKRLTVILGSALLALVAFSVFVAPSNMANTLVAGAYFGSIVFAVSGIVSRRKAKVHRAEFALLREDVKRLLDAEHRRILKKVTTSKQKPD
jgi:hypothetical protein